MTDTFYAYHVVTDRPLKLGQHILFDETHHSGVYERVMARLDTVNDIYRDPQKYEGAELEYPVTVALRELALEEVRAEKYPHYPSRMGCLYVIPELGRVFHRSGQTHLFHRKGQGNGKTFYRGRHQML